MTSTSYRPDGYEQLQDPAQKVVALERYADRLGAELQEAQQDCELLSERNELLIPLVQQGNTALRNSGDDGKVTFVQILALTVLVSFPANWFVHRLLNSHRDTSRSQISGSQEINNSNQFAGEHYKGGSQYQYNAEPVRRYPRPVQPAPTRLPADDLFSAPEETQANNSEEYQDDSLDDLFGSPVEQEKRTEPHNDLFDAPKQPEVDDLFSNPVREKSASEHDDLFDPPKEREEDSEEVDDLFGNPSNNKKEEESSSQDDDLFGSSN